MRNSPLFRALDGMVVGTMAFPMNANVSLYLCAYGCFEQKFIHIFRVNVINQKQKLYSFYSTRKYSSKLHIYFHCFVLVLVRYAGFNQNLHKRFAD